MPSESHPSVRAVFSVAFLSVYSVVSSVVAQSVDIDDVSIATNQVVVRWNAETGKAYEVESTLAVAGPWTARGSSIADATNMSWSETDMLSASQRFYRLWASNIVRQVQLDEVQSWAYNIQFVNTTQQWNELVGTHFDMYVLEPVVTEAGEESFPIDVLIQSIRDYNIAQHNKNPIVLAYVDIGQAESWRWYWQSGWGLDDPPWIVVEDPDGWTDNYPVAYWYDQWQDIVIYGTNGNSHVNVTLNEGFDGIYLDWVEAFADDDAIALEAIWYDGDEGFDDWTNTNGFNKLTDDIFPGWTDEVLGYLEPMKGRFPIFCCEYAQDYAGGTNATYVYTVRAATNGFIPYCTRRSLQRLSTTPYPAGYVPVDY